MASFGELIYLLDDGLKIPAKLMETIGVLDGSVCWGLWVESEKKEGELHLVISPIPPKDWERAFSLQLVLNERIGALADACKIIRDRGVDIAVIDAAVSGHTHSIANAICLAKSETNSQNITDTGGPEGKNLRIKTIGQDIIKDMLQLTMDLRLQDNLRISENLPPFLHTSTVKNAYAPFGLDLDGTINDIGLENNGEFSKLINSFKNARNEFSKKNWAWPEYDYFFHDAEKSREEHAKKFRERFFRFIWRHQRFHPVTARALSRLARCVVWAKGEPASAIKLRFRAKNNMLEFYDHANSERFAEELKDASRPIHALASINRQDRFLRVKFFDKASLSCRELYLIDVEYSILRKQNGCNSSLGMLHELTKKFENDKLEICYVRSLLTELSDEMERGVVRFVVPACLSGPPQEHFDKLLRTKNESTRRAKNNEARSFNGDQSSTPPASVSGQEREPTTYIKDVRVSLAASRRVFISMPTGAARRDDICKIIEESCKAQGFIPEYVLNAHGPITKNVRDRVRECDAFMQIVVLRESEVMNSINDRNFHPNFAWLHFEWGLGVAQELHSCRFVDSTIPKRLLDSNIIPTNRDDYHAFFSTASDLSGLRSEIIAFLAACPSTPFVKSFHGERN